MNQAPDAPVIVPTSALAIVSLIAGVAGWCLLPFIGTLTAVICGHLARREIRRAGGPTVLQGDNMAKAGIILGYVQIGLFILALAAFVTLVILIGPLPHG